MRLIKLALISFIFLSGIITVISLFIPSHIKISRAVHIKAPKDSLAALIASQGGWSQWNPVFMRPDPQHPPINTRFTLVTDTLVQAEWQQGKKSPVLTTWRIYEIPQMDSLTVHWSMDFHQGWLPWKKFESLFFDKAYGGLMDEGLGNLKVLAHGKWMKDGD
jgi:hypothetical protein